MKQAVPLQWTPEQVDQFWNYWAQRPDAHARYFARQVGQAVAEFLNYARPLAGLHVLDYGCGTGYLIPHLLERGARVSAADYSQSSVALVNETFGGRPTWNGAKLITGSALPWPDATFDLVCCLETIEHVLPEHLEGMFRELRRVLKPGGTALFTTPNDEKLESSFIFCPNCSSEFHRWQHVRRWTEDELREALIKSGYEVTFCRGLNFWSFQRKPRPSWKHVTIAYLVSQLKHLGRRLLDRWHPRPFPQGRVFENLLRRQEPCHLVALANRPAA